MKTLLWRDYRLNRTLLIAGTVLMLLPFFFAFVGILLRTVDTTSSRVDFAEFFVTAAMLSCGLSQLTVSFLGSNAFAGERVDRSAEFMAYLPVSRERRVVSKLTLSAVVAAAIWGINLIVIWVLSDGLKWHRDHGNDIREMLSYTAVTGFVMFGVGWFISSLQSSPTFAACGGIATPIVTLMGLQLTGYILSKNLSREVFDNPAYTRLMEVGYISISLVLGALGLGLGTWQFLKRVEP